MEELRTTTNIVKYILESDERARNNDGYLYFKVLDFCGHRDGINYIQMTVHDFLPHVNSMGVPNSETVRRTRQKIQQHHPNLAPCDAVKENRHKNEEKFRVYARGVLQ